MPLTVTDLKFKQTARKVMVEGKAAPGTTVKVENLSVAPFKEDWVKDGFTTAKAGKDGVFRATVKGGVEGDRVRVSTADASAVVTLRAGGKDTRRAEFNVQSLRLQESAGGYAFTSVSRNPLVGEPGAQVQITNQRSGQSLITTLDDLGRFPKDLRVPGQAGDVISFATSDGARNTDFKDTCGNVVIPVKTTAVSVRAPVEPPPMLEDRAKVQSTRLTGPLFVEGPAATDPQQGQVGDCYLVATAASLAQTRPEALQKLIRDNGDGTYTVAFKRWDPAAATYREDPVTVSNSFPTQHGAAYYGSSAQPKELWFPVLEKAYAAWKGGYDAIRSGYPYEVFEACLGQAGKHFDTRVDKGPETFQALKDATDKKEPMVAWTGVESPEHPFTNTGLVADHAYTVLGVEERNGQKLVTLRNPWGCTEPAGNGRDDGVFTLPWETFVKHYDGVGVAA